VDPLDLAVEDGVGIDDLTGGSPEPVDKPFLGVAFGVQDAFAERRVAGQARQGAKLIEGR
jgi:hypothetical protein